MHECCWRWLGCPSDSAVLLVCAQDPASQLSWFNYLVCDPAASEPGEFERAGSNATYLWPLNRLTRLSWDALRPVVEAALATSPAQWRDELWPANANTFFLLPGGQVARGNASLPRWSCPNVLDPPPYKQEVRQAATARVSCTARRLASAVAARRSSTSAMCRGSCLPPQPRASCC